MTTATYNRRSLGIGEDIIAASPIDVRIESDASPEEISSFLISLAALIGNDGAESEESSRGYNPLEAAAYYRNKYGDEYAFVDELGIEPSYMGLRADHNHVF